MLDAPAWRCRISLSLSLSSPGSGPLRSAPAGRPDSPVGGKGRGGRVTHARFAEIQRARLLAAAVRAVEELGYPDTSVADITSRARVSRRTFYELFSDREECLAAALEDILGVIAAEVAAAGLDGRGWRERVRGGLWAILSCFDREPALARVCVVQALRGGPRVLERREGVLAQLAGVVDGGRLESERAARCTSLTAEGVVGAAFSIVYSRLLRGERGSLTGLFGELMGMIVLPYLGPAAARREQERAVPMAASGARAGGGVAESVADPLDGVAMRLTYRTARVLEGIAEHPGASNREAGECAGISDPGQVSKLLARLERLGLLVNRTGGGRVMGEPNAWTLTAKGVVVARNIRMYSPAVAGSEDAPVGVASSVGGRGVSPSDFDTRLGGT
jgi:AcrR family transcriptional regulator/DNA-binding MarR family transcriptional regulator